MNHSLVNLNSSTSIIGGGINSGCTSTTGSNHGQPTRRCRRACTRTSPEALSLTCKHVDLNKARLTIYAQKTGKKRVVPIVGRLMELLTQIKVRDQGGTGSVLSISTNKLRRELHRLLKRAGLEPWEDCFQVLRRNCETDWSQQFPQHVVSRWVGHSILVSARHYLQVPEEVYERARTMR